MKPSLKIVKLLRLHVLTVRTKILNVRNDFKQKNDNNKTAGETAGCISVVIQGLSNW